MLRFMRSLTGITRLIVRGIGGMSKLSSGFSCIARKKWGERRRVLFARATNLDLPKREVLDLYNKVRGPIEASYRNIKAFLPFTSSTKFVFRTLIFVLALVLYSLFKGEVGREEFRLLLILLFPDLFNPENFTINVIKTLIYTIDLFLRRWFWVYREGRGLSLVLSFTELRERTKLDRNKLWRALTRLQLEGRRRVVC